MKVKGISASVDRLGIDDLDDAISLIYEAALDSELWPAALKRIADLGGGAQTILFTFEPGTAQLVHALASDHATTDSGAAYLAHYARLDPRNTYGAAQPVGTRFTDYAFITEAEMGRSEFYHDYLWPNDLGYVGAKSLKNDRGGIVGAAIQRSRRQGPFDLRDLDLLDRLGPHLLRALRLQTRYAELDARRWADRTLRDRLPFAVILVAAGGRILSLNQMASTLLAQGDGLTARHDRLRTALSSDQAALDRLIRDAAATAEGAGAAGGGAMPLHCASLRRPLSAFVVPLPRRSESLLLDLVTRRPAAAVIVTDPEAAPEPPGAALRRLFGLSPAEAGLACALTVGKSLQEYALEAGIRTETARWRLKQVFAKTDTRRQAELVRLILTSAVFGQR